MALIQGAQLDFVFNSSTPYIEDYNIGSSQYNQPKFFDQQDLSDDIKAPIMKKKELEMDYSMEGFQGEGGGGSGSGGRGGGGGGGRGGGGGGGGGGGRGSGGGYGHRGGGHHRGGHHGGRHHRGGGWGPYYNGGYGSGYGGGYFIDNIPNVSVNYWDDEGPYYDEPREVIIEKPIYIREKDPDDESVKIETISSEDKKTKKNKKTKKIKEKKEIDNKTLWNIIILLIIIILILGLKMCYDNKLIRF